MRGPLRHPADLDPVAPLDVPLARLERAREEPEQRRLAGAVRSDERDRLASAQLELRRLQGDARAEAPARAAGREEGRRVAHRAAAAGGGGSPGGGSGAAATGRTSVSASSATSTGTVAPGSQGSSAIRSAKNSQIARPAGEQRQRDEDPRQAVDLAAREQAEDHEQRVQAQRAPHHLRHDDVPLDLVDEQEEDDHPHRRERMDEERVENRRHRPEPRAEVGDQLHQRHPRAEEERVAAAREPAEHAEHPQPDAGARADDQREQHLPLHVADERTLDARHERLGPRVRPEPPVHRGGEPLHVEQHVDRDHDDQHAAEEEPGEREAGALRPVERLRRVLLDVLRADAVEEVRALLLDADLLQTVCV